MDPRPRLSLYEKKALLINAEFDAMGMGKYQWFVWSLCGLGYFLDLLWAQAFGLIATPLQQELGFSSKCPASAFVINATAQADSADAELGNIFTAFNAGLCAGAFVWGILVDIIGNVACSSRCSPQESALTGQVGNGPSTAPCSSPVSLGCAWEHQIPTMPFSCSRLSTGLGSGAISPSTRRSAWSSFLR